MVEYTASILLLSSLVIGCNAPESKVHEKVNASVIEKDLYKEGHAQISPLYVLHGPCVLLLQESAGVEIFQETLSCVIVCRPRLTSWTATVLLQ